MLIAHLSDLHLTREGDVAWLARQLDRIALRRPHHLAITGDLLDRWSPRLLAAALDALGSRGWLEARRLTILHGNHDLASSGGYPRTHTDLWRLGLRFWDPPPLVRWRRRRFYETVQQRGSGIAPALPFLKAIGGIRLAGIDTIPLHWRPVRMGGGILAVRHAIGCVRAGQSDWLSTIPAADDPLVVLLHHYPLETPALEWTPPRSWRMPFQTVRVPMEIPSAERERLWKAAAAAGARLMVCGHVHRARFEWRDGIAVGLNGQSGAAWAGRTIGYYEIDGSGITAEHERVDA